MNARQARSIRAGIMLARDEILVDNRVSHALVARAFVLTRSQMRECRGPGWHVQMTVLSGGSDVVDAIKREVKRELHHDAMRRWIS